MFPVYGSRFPLAPVSACYSSVYEGIFAKNTKFEKFVSLYTKFEKFVSLFLPHRGFTVSPRRTKLLRFLFSVREFFDGGVVFLAREQSHDVSAVREPGEEAVEEQ